MTQPQLKSPSTPSPLTHTYLHKSQRHLLVDKTVMVIGGGDYSIRQRWTDAAELGVKLVLVDSDPHHAARPVVDTFLHVDITDHTQDIEHSSTILRLLRERLPERKVDGCLAWVDDCVPLVAYVSQALGLQHALSVEAALNAKSKVRTHVVLGEQASESSPQSSPAVYASPVVKVNAVEELAEAFKKIPLPVVMKLECGFCAVGVKHVETVEEAEEHMRHVQETLHSDDVIPGVGLGYGQTMILMPRLQGTEHDVELVLYKGTLVAAYISDNGPTHVPYCMETAAAMPSTQREEKQQQLTYAAVECCRGLGLHTGVFNIELMLTSGGPLLIEVNARMGGLYMRDWVRLVHQVDLLPLALLCACGIHPLLPETSEETLIYHSKHAVSTKQKDFQNRFLMGIQLYISRQAEALAAKALLEQLQRLHEEGQVVFLQFQKDVAPTVSVFEKPYGNLAVRAPSPAEAKAKLVNICTQLGLEPKESVLEVLSHFRP